MQSPPEEQCQATSGQLKRGDVDVVVVHVLGRGDKGEAAGQAVEEDLKAEPLVLELEAGYVVALPNQELQSEDNLSGGDYEEGGVQVDRLECVQVGGELAEAEALVDQDCVQDYLAKEAVGGVIYISKWARK